MKQTASAALCSLLERRRDWVCISICRWRLGPCFVVVVSTWIPGHSQLRQDGPRFMRLYVGLRKRPIAVVVSKRTTQGFITRQPTATATPDAQSRRTSCQNSASRALKSVGLGLVRSRHRSVAFPCFAARYGNHLTGVRQARQGDVPNARLSIIRYVSKPLLLLHDRRAAYAGNYGCDGRALVDIRTSDLVVHARVRRHLGATGTALYLSHSPLSLPTQNFCLREVSGTG